MAENVLMSEKNEKLVHINTSRPFSVENSQAVIDYVRTTYFFHKDI